MKRIIISAVAVLAIAATISPAQAQPAASHFVAHLTGDQEVPARTTRAVGQIVLDAGPNDTSLEFMLMVANIENVVASHIHLGPAGSNGPVVAFLYGSVSPAGGRVQGVLARGTITSSDLVGPLAGQDLSVLFAALRTGGAYANVHTNDGIGDVNTGPGDFPGGEIRGQISVTGP